VILTHYYHKRDRPFQSLSSLAEAEALNIIESLQERTGNVYRRFGNPVQYLRDRRATESWLRAEFIAKGGQPQTLYPQYLTIGRSPWIEDGFEGQSNFIQVPIASVCVDRVSFTYPDSMVTHWLQSQCGQIFHHPEYHGQVFTLTEIYQIIDRFGIPDREWQTKPTHKYDLFIEAQVWGTIE
jgi:hypothetical protein